MDGHRTCRLVAAGGKWAGLSGGVGLDKCGGLNVSVTRYTGDLVADGAFFKSEK